MLEGKKEILEVECGDAWASRIVKQTVESLTVSDFNELFLKDAKERHDENWPLKYRNLNLAEEPTGIRYDAIYLLDVFEHIPQDKEA